MLSELRDALNTKLQTLTWASKPFKSVLNYHTLNNTWYPYVTFEPTEFTATILDNCNNMREVAFDLFVYQEIAWPSRAEAVDIVIKGIDSLIALFDENYTLDWLVLWGILPISCDIGQLNLSNWKAIFWRVRIVCKMIQSIHY